MMNKLLILSALLLVGCIPCPNCEREESFNRLERQVEQMNKETEAWHEEIKDYPVCYYYMVCGDPIDNCNGDIPPKGCHKSRYPMHANSVPCVDVTMKYLEPYCNISLNHPYR